MYLDRQRYTVIWPYTVCQRNTKTKISRTHTHADGFFWGDVSIRNLLRSNYYVMYSFLLVYCGPAGNFVSSSGAARLPLQYATGVRNLLVYLSLVS